MGKKSRPPPPPDYSAAARATAEGNWQNTQRTVGTNRFTDVGPTGQSSWSLRPGADPNNPQPGDFVRTTTLSQGQQDVLGGVERGATQAGGLASDLMGGYQPDFAGRDRLTESLFRRATQFADRRFNRDEEALRTRLINQGLAAGSEGYDDAVRTFGENRDAFYSDAADRAAIGGEQQFQANQNNAIQRIAALLAQQRGGLQGFQSDNDWDAPPVAGPDLLGATGQQYNAEVARTNAINAGRAAPWQAITGLGAAWLMGGRGLPGRRPA